MVGIIKVPSEVATFADVEERTVDIVDDITLKPLRDWTRVEVVDSSLLEIAIMFSAKGCIVNVFTYILLMLQYLLGQGHLLPILQPPSSSDCSC